MAIKKEKASKKPAATSKEKAKKAPTKKASAGKKGQPSKMPTKAALEKMRQDDAGYVAAQKNPVEYIEGRRQAMYNISRNYHLDVEDVCQEAYEVLLTCLRDYTPVFERNDGTLVNVMFNTFFGNRMESRAMEMRNANPEYQARQAFTDRLDDGEKESFRQDPPLLVQHLDHESPMQEMLVGEASSARDGEIMDNGLKILRDSYFDQKLNELISKETDEKKRAALLHVKVGGVYNFQEMAYHFGVTDSRASQVMNELMDAFFIQRMITGSLPAVVNDFKKLRFNEKRIERMVLDAMESAPPERVESMMKTFTGVEDLEAKYSKRVKRLQMSDDAEALPSSSKPRKVMGKRIPVEEVLTEEENKKYPLVSVELRPIDRLKFYDFTFRPEDTETDFQEFVDSIDWVDDSLYPALISEEGYVIDGERHIRAAQLKGRREYMCITRKISNDFDRKLLRVMINLRAHKPSKVDLYYAIGALADMGLSQQRIADCVGTSRTNVLVYVKVRDKATPKVRALFEDGLMQVTNASTCADLNDDMQDRLAAFVRRFGATWSKGSKFNKLHLAAVENKMDELEEEVAPKDGTLVVEHMEELPAATATSSKAVQAMHKRIEAYEQALKDNEIWSQRREGVINSQTELIEQMQQENESLKRELEAADLMRFGSPDAIEAELRALKNYYAVIERLSSVDHALSYAGRELKRLALRKTQTLEVNTIVEDIEQRLNALRVEMINRGVAKRPDVPQAANES